MKKILILIFIVILGTGNAKAQSLEDVNGAADTEFNFSDAVDCFSEGKSIISGEDIFDKVLKTAAEETVKNIKAVLGAVLTGIILAVFSGMCAVNRSSVSEAAEYVSYMITAGLLLSGFSGVSEVGTELSEKIVTYQNALIPCLGTAIISSGGFSGFSAAAPTALLLSSLLSNIIKLLGIPGVFFSFVLSTAGRITDREILLSLGKTISKAALFAVSVAATVFTAIIGACGLSGAAAGNAALRGMKFAVSGLVPVLGGILSDSVEAVAAGAELLRGAVGAAGILFLFLIYIFPVVKIGTAILVYKIAAAIMESVCDKKTAGLLSDMGDVLGTLIGFATAAGVSALLSLVILLSGSGVIR